MPADLDVELQIAGRVHSTWTAYDIDSSLLIAADAWNLMLATRDLEVPQEIQAGVSVRLRVGGEVVLAGLLDEWEHVVDKDGRHLRLSGRDMAGVLIDCSAPVFTAQQLNLDQVVAKIVRPLGITRIRIDAEQQLRRERVSTEPGDTAWDMLRRAAEANGLWPWFEPDGTLVVGGPDYSAPAVASLILRRDGTGRNVLGLAERRSIADRYSEVTVLGQAHAVGVQQGRHNVRATVRDDGVTTYRPKVVTDHEAATPAIAAARAKKLISDARVGSFELRALVRGHRTDSGMLWSAGQRVHIVSEPHGLDGIYFVMQRRFTLDKARGQVTHLSLREDGVWALYAHPSTRKHRKGKNSLPGRILDAAVGAPG